MKKSLIALIVSLLFSTGGTTQDTPELQNRYSEGGWSNNSAVTGETAYLTLSTHLVILDISGETIVKAGEFELPGEPSALLAQDGYLFACYAGSDSSLQVLDISDPLEPVSLGRVAGRSGRPLNASLSSGLLLFPTQNRILIFDVSNPADVRVRAEIPLDGVRAAALDGGILVAGTSDSLLVYDCGNWNAVACIHRQPVPRVDCMTLTDGRAYVGTAEYPDIGVKILDMGNPAAPSDLAVVETKVTEGFVTEYMNPMQIRAEGNLLYVSTSGSTSLFLFDLTDVRNPRLSGTFRLEGENWISGRSLDVRHPRAYLCLSGSSVPFCRLDVTNPAAPVPNGVYEAPVSLKHQVLSNDTLYLAGEKRLWMYKIRDPQTVEPIGSSRAWHSLNGMAVSNTRLVAVRADSLFVLDCSDPGDIRALGVYVTSRGEFRKPVAAGNRVHVIAVNEQTSFLETIDIADPQHPARLSEYDLQGEGRDLFIAPSDPGRLYAAYASAGGRQGVAVLDARNPAAITVTSDVQTRAVPVSIAVADTLLLAGSN
ncbi:hypothetical protein JW777_01855, partial [bacterium]|nr:hypothetical protein [bacterium]